MGNGQSPVYPDNRNHYNRAQQLGNDYEISKYQFERILDPTSPRSIESRRHSFGCNGLDDLSRLVEKNWDRRSPRGVESRQAYTWQDPNATIAFEFSAAVGGPAISTAGALTGGIPITGQILLVLGVIGLIFDAIMGVVNRAKLRNAINLFRRKIVAHSDNLFLWMPIIHEIYQTFEEAGFTEEQIIKKLKDKKFNEPIQEDTKDEDYYSITRSLRDLDESRES